MIDLLDGAVVHAKQGLRHTYQPITSSLTASSKPLEIIKALLDVYTFDTLYIADLTAIQQRGKSQHATLVADIMEVYPDMHIWLDAGITPSQSHNSSITANNLFTVLGTESFTNISDYLTQHQALNHHAILSLDHMPMGYQGPPELLQTSHHWPQHVIAMTLQRVGSNTGLDTHTLSKLRAISQQHKLYAAGGVRDKHDLVQLQNLGMNGALVATALHNKQITTHDLINLSP